ncbi:MAG: hypothetical protein OEZ57_09565 [Nitrospirota bacterium]|nr:hypothetical protein [Nitrospirota bacterium]MDH5587342.1 hypothetical protein [Nitrospirota bacterium]MDH5775145.1 hypothetical protein [Nitrospirota bacterium]
MKRAVIIVMVLGGGLVGLWLYFFPSYSWHQKMTVEVEVDGQLYSGSSVVAMTVTGNPNFRIVPAVRKLEMRGEAVVIDLPKNRYLFALLNYNAFLASKVFSDKMDGLLSQTGEGWAKIISELQETRDVAPKDYPLLATFMDINDSTTVKNVDPSDLAATFGQGVTLKRITLGITDEPVTEGRVEAVLPWLYDVESLIPRSQLAPLIRDQTPDQSIKLRYFMDWRTMQTARERN